MRLLGVDFGTVRIGLAVVETTMQVIRTLPPIAATGTLRKDADTIAKAIATEKVDQVVLGIPNINGSEGGAAKIIHRLGDLIAETGTPVTYVDESMTSREAESEMRAHGLKASQMRKAVDGMAAALILERFLEGHEEAV